MHLAASRLVLVSGVYSLKPLIRSLRFHCFPEFPAAAPHPPAVSANRCRAKEAAGGDQREAHWPKLLFGLNRGGPGSVVPAQAASLLKDSRVSFCKSFSMKPSFAWTPAKTELRAP